MWILISWLYKKPADLDQHCFHKRINRDSANQGLKFLENKYVKKLMDCTPGLENSTRPLVFTSVSGCRASEYFDISTEN